MFRAMKAIFRESSITKEYIYNKMLLQIYSQGTTNKMRRFSNLFIFVRRSTCFRRFFRPSSGAQNCTYSVRYLSDCYCYLLLAGGEYWSHKFLTLYVQFWAPDDGRKNRLKHVERLTEINKLWNVASCWLYSANSYR